MQWWRQLATSIVFGLGFATLLTLVVTPAALMLRGNIWSWLERRRNKARQAPIPGGAERLSSRPSPHRGLRLGLLPRRFHSGGGTDTERNGAQVNH